MLDLVVLERGSKDYVILYAGTRHIDPLARKPQPSIDGVRARRDRGRLERGRRRAFWPDVRFLIC